MYSKQNLIFTILKNIRKKNCLPENLVFETDNTVNY
jgi:hypothetical protein